MRAILTLIVVQLFAGTGIASGYAVGGLLAERITGHTSMAGFAQMSVILGAGLLAYPLAALAGRRGRRTALTLGFGIGAAGTLVVLLGTSLSLLPVFMFGMMMCGSSTAAGLQARYAAVDAASPATAARAMSFVVWATTVGSVLGPNFTAPGAVLGEWLGLDPLAGPYLISLVAFALATTAAATLPAHRADSAGGTHDRIGLRSALRSAGQRPLVVLAMVTIIAGQMMMTNVMVMTPVHMDHQHFELAAIGIVVSAHIAGMYGLSPIFGWMADKFGALSVLALGVAVFAVTIVLGVWDALQERSSMALLSAALLLLGIGWSIFLIGGSALLTRESEPRARVALQGFSDSAMNLGGALMAAFAGTVLGFGGFLGINLMATAVLLIVIATAAWALTRRSVTF